MLMWTMRWGERFPRLASESAITAYESQYSELLSPSPVQLKLK
jgi:hypothetical protein